MTNPDSIPAPLSFSSYNEDQIETIVLLHGLTSSKLEWNAVRPFLSTYHLLLPDLPSHSNSPNIEPFTIPRAAELIASLICTHAHNGKAHVVGLSLGGFIARHLAQTHPELINSLFITGAVSGNSGEAWLTRSRVAATLFVLPNVALPVSAYCAGATWMGIRSMTPEIARETKRNSKTRLIRQAFGEMSMVKNDVEITIRTLAVAGEKQDNVEGTRQLGLVLKRGNGESKACVVVGGLHWWSLQWPELFAEAVEAWIEKQTLPDGLKEL